MQTKKGFTLIELLVVIAIIALLLSIILPALKMVKEKGRQVVCAASLKGIGAAVSAFLVDNDDTFHFGSNHGLWKNWEGIVTNFPAGEPFPYENGRAYWGVAYAQYSSGKNVFECPSARVGDVDVWCRPGELFAGRQPSEVFPYFKNCAYGLNSYTNSKREGDSNEERVKAATFKLPAKVIFAQDHIEQLMDHTGTGWADMFCLNTATGGPNLQQWRNIQNEPGGFYPDILAANFRHSKRSNGRDGYSNTLWLDGHVDPIRETNGEDVPVRWYSGG